VRAGSQRSAFRGQKCCAVVLWLLPVWLALDSLAQEELPKLLPPHGELPPTLWEQYGMAIVIVGVAVLLLLAFTIWWWLRPKPAVIVPPEIQVRTALEALRNTPEDGCTLSSVSQILRRYVIAAFELPPGEFSTTEFRQLVVANSKIGSDLAAAMSEFMLRCDERKFSGSDAALPTNTVTRALELVAMAETRHAQLRQIVAVEQSAAVHA
jgi:hypothetical protein